MVILLVRILVPPHHINLFQSRTNASRALAARCNKWVGVLVSGITTSRVSDSGITTSRVLVSGITTSRGVG